MTGIIEKIRASEEALTVSRLAKYLSMDRGTTYDHVERSTLPALRIGTTIRLDPKDVVEYLGSGTYMFARYEANFRHALGIS
jgi:excisionase family DNA binding protein